MSEEQLKSFLAKVQTDSSLQEQLKAPGADAVAIAKAAGFIVTADELSNAKNVLSDYELENVSGGATNQHTAECSPGKCSANTFKCNPNCK